MTRTTKRYGIFVLCIAAVLASGAQTFTVVANFNGSKGANPNSLVQATDGNLWGTTNSGGSSNCGAVFKMTTAGALTRVQSFNCTSGGNEPLGVIQGADGNFYGTTFSGGSNGSGTAFKLTPAGVLNTLYSFTGGSDGASPVGSLVQGTDGNFYGAAYGGGTYGWGSLFKFTPTGTLTPLYEFDFTHGSQPYMGLIQATNGNFYGTTYDGGASGGGTVFKVSYKGVESVVYNLGAGALAPSYPDGALVQGRDGNFYGTTTYGGPANDGTVFKVTPSGVLTVLHNFSGLDGWGPNGALIQATDGNFYGCTGGGGTNDHGTVFKLTPKGAFTTLHNFNGADGGSPWVIMQDTNGSLYGLAFDSGGYGDGAVFRIDLGLAPFVATQTSSGFAGQVVNILGQGLTGTTGVKFGSGAAAFTVVSDTYVTATIPTSGTTGLVTVTTPTGTLTRNKSFKVIPTLTSFNPTSGAPGTSVTLTGTGLMAATKVTFGGVQAAFTISSGTQVTANVPAGAKTGKIAVTTTGGTASKGTFTVTSSPLITSLLVNGTPSNTGQIGDTLTIQGSGFGATMGFSIATLNGLAVAGGGVRPISWSDTRIDAIIPNTASSGPVIVTVRGQGPSNAWSFVVLPIITGTMPSSVLAGTSVTVIGRGFGTQGGYVTFNGLNVTVSGWIESSISAQVPIAATAGPIVVTVSGVASNGWTFTPTPSVTTLSPNSGPAGTLVTIAGNSFGNQQGTSTVTFNGVPASINSWVNTQIVAVAPSGTTTGNVIVTVNGVQSAGQLFTYTP